MGRLCSLLSILTKALSGRHGSFNILKPSQVYRERNTQAQNRQICLEEYKIPTTPGLASGKHVSSLILRAGLWRRRLKSCTNSASLKALGQSKSAITPRESRRVHDSRQFGATNGSFEGDTALPWASRDDRLIRLMPRISSKSVIVDWGFDIPKHVVPSSVVA